MALKLILASASPRRRELLAQLGFPFTVETVPVEELTQAQCPDPESVPLCNARLKAEAAATLHPEALVLGADTVIVYRGRVIGKPADPADARAILSELAGDSHEVVTGISLIGPGIARNFTVKTAVRFRPYGPETIERYLQLVSVLDKAGAYAIQEHGELLVEGVSGSESNIVGLPLEKLAKELAEVMERENEKMVHQSRDSVPRR